jgi:tetratricopeptide (TPR) repeat protein
LTFTSWSLFAALIVGLGLVWNASAAGPIGMLWSLACTACGFVVGFLFGVPRVVEDGTARSPALDERARASAARHRLAVNTNLTQISDWLTKIIVGVGLVELKQIPDHLARAGDYIGRALQPQATQANAETPSLAMYAPVAASVVVFFTALGFLAGYLLTRMYFSPAFGRADEGLEIPEAAKDAFRNTPLEQNGQKVEVSAAAADKTSLLSVPLEAVPETADDLAVWARAQFDAGKYHEAVAAYATAVEKNPNHPRLRYAYAIALKYAADNQNGNPIVVEELEKARALVDRRPDLQLRAIVYASLTFHTLYLDKPRGFERARDTARSYVARPDNLPNADIWFNLACALGQQYAWERNNPNVSKEHLKSVRDEAAGALQKAIALQPQLSRRASEMINGNPPEDDDLNALAEDDERVKTVLGVSK